MSDGYISRRNLLQELPFVSELSYETREKVRNLILRMPEMNMIDRDVGKEPILEQGSSLVHSTMADGTGKLENIPYLDWKCPTCKWFVGELYSGHGMWHIQSETSYCARCGQKIDWTKPKDEEKWRYEERMAKEREQRLRETGMRLDNMHEGRRRKYGMLQEDKDGSH